LAAIKLNNPDAYAVLRIRDFRYFVSARFMLTFAIQMQSVVVGWQVYEITHDVLSLGLIGLAEAIPFIASAIFAGYIADRYNRQKVMVVSMLVYLAGALLLLAYSLGYPSFLGVVGVLPLYIVVFLTGIARAFFYPAQLALMAQLVPRNLYANSSTWNSTVWHIAAVGGPATGGLIYGFAGKQAAYGVVVFFVVLSFILFMQLAKYRNQHNLKGEPLLQSLSTGIKFVFRNQVILGALSLDMFAVLFGGAVAMLPVFASEILFVGPQGLGFLRAAPAFGAIIMALILAYRPPLKKAGVYLLSMVGVFGLTIVGFAISTNFYLSIFLLVMGGMADNVSVIIRSTILQLMTPDSMRGRVAAVNSIFVGSSNEIGSFESGLAAKIMGLVPSVIFGGSMTVLITGIMARFAPNLRNLDLKERTGLK
jgi:MFS family permease